MKFEDEIKAEIGKFADVYLPAYIEFVKISHSYQPKRNELVCGRRGAELLMNL